MNEIIKPQQDESGELKISGRELHMFLEVGTPYDKWFPRMSGYGFTEGIDFSTKMSESTGGRPATDHLMTVDMAKEISMLQRTKKARKLGSIFFSWKKNGTARKRSWPERSSCRSGCLMLQSWNWPRPSRLSMSCSQKPVTMI